ncbi:hypothetical protein [Streptomyces sp. NPDC089919]|uniref:hypothetical protein n=1 Tax=Streptomyces sp. NPDC089919 TaxID=3155188 RepID=UPI0034146AD0
MRISALPAALVLTAGALAATAAPAAAEPASVVTLEVGLNNHHNTGRVTYERIDGAVNSVRILTVEATGGLVDCAWLQWNDPNGIDGWSIIQSEPSCNGGTLVEQPGMVIKAPAGHPLKVRLAGYHDGGVVVIHKDIAKL